MPELESNDNEDLIKCIDNDSIEIVESYSFSHLYTAPVENGDDILMQSFMIHNDDIMDRLMIDDYGNEIYNDV